MLPTKKVSINKKMEKLKNQNLYNIEQTIAKDLLLENEYPWECLSKIKDYIISKGKNLDLSKYEQIKENVWIAKSAKIAPTACINGPTIIDENAEIRHCAFIRGNVIVGKDAVVGNSTELKNCILFNEVQVPHYNYVGDSILGFCAHMGAGSIVSNIKSDKTDVTIKYDDKKIETHLRKCGAILGDFVEVGCNSVLNPGTIVGKNTSIYPLSFVRGYVEENSIYKNKNEIVEKF